MISLPCSETASQAGSVGVPGADLGPVSVQELSAVCVCQLGCGLIPGQMRGQACPHWMQRRPSSEQARVSPGAPPCAARSDMGTSVRRWLQSPGNAQGRVKPQTLGLREHGRPSASSPGEGLCGSPEPDGLDRAPGAGRVEMVKARGRCHAGRWCHSRQGSFCPSGHPGVHSLQDRAAAGTRDHVQRGPCPVGAEAGQSPLPTGPWKTRAPLLEPTLLAPPLF